jgi:putative ATP-dependent endonuclease of the OLD family
MQIRRLWIQNFRGITDLTWTPGPGLNAILGAGDSGKSTVLDAIALALSPQPSQAAVETDYQNLDTSTPFRIALVLGQLSDAFRAVTYPPALWGWDAGTRELLPAPNDELGHEAVAHIEVVGTVDLELQHHLLQPGNDPRPLTVAARAAAGLWNVSTNRAPDAQLRMSRGSLLERAIGRERMRAPAVAAMQGTVQTLRVPSDTTIAIERVASQLRAAGIKFDDLALSLVPSPGQSPVQLVTLVAKSGDGHVPLANFGRGSQQMAMVTLAAAEIVDAPIAVIDEIEAGLEPYRQRALLARLREMLAPDGQAFVTSHSPAVLGRLTSNECWTLRFQEVHSMRQIDGAMYRLLRDDPEALLCKVPVICEGATEVGVLRAFFSEARDADYTALGVHLVDAGGHEAALTTVAALATDERKAFALVDQEDFSAGKRASLAALRGVHLCQSTGGRCVECAVANALPLGALEGLLLLPGIAGAHLNANSRLQAVTSRLGQQSRQTLEEMISAHGELAVRDAIGEAASKDGWFKSLEAGQRLGEFMLANIPPDSPFLSDLRGLVRAALAATSADQDDAE